MSGEHLSELMLDLLARGRDCEFGCYGGICGGCEEDRPYSTILESLFDIRREDRTSYSTNTEGRRA